MSAFRTMILCCVAVLALVPTGCGGDDGACPDGVLCVGVILPMSGPQATYGEESWNGLELAAEDIRGKGAPIEFQLVQRDEKSSKQTAGDQAKDLIESARAHVILGSVASSNSMQIFQECRESGVPGITPASTNDQLIADGDEWVSRICFKDAFQGREVLARFAWKQGWRRVAAAVDKGQDYSVGLADNFKRGFEALGGEVSFEYFTAEDADFSNVIQSVANRRPDAILISGYYEAAGPMIQQAKDKWKGVPVFGGDGLDSPNLLGYLGGATSDVYFSTHFAADAPDPAVRAFAERYRERFKKSPGAMAALGYDVLFVLMDAVRRCDDPLDRKQLARAILETKNVKGITGTIDLTSPDHTPVKDAVIVKVKGNAFTYFDTIAPGDAAGGDEARSGNDAERPAGAPAGDRGGR
jgi:branched-chain amino acid transport system substrate-binding protein